MDNTINNSFLKKSKEEVNLMSPLIWAYVGDAVYEVYIRKHLVDTTNLNVHKLHIKSIQYVRASSQAHILQELMLYLNSEEENIVRRTRNAENHHLPKNASVEEYMYATAFEGLIGYLYLTDQEERLKEILEKCIEIENTFLT